VPQDAGLMTFDAAAPYRYYSFKVVKRPRLNKEWKFDENFTMRLLMGRWGSEPSLLAKKMSDFHLNPPTGEPPHDPNPR
jgi:hypothetical protein